jgi:RNA methyltransferase, TrmH family
MHPEITSAGNPRVKELLALRRRRMRDRSALTLVEGYEELVMALAAGVRPRVIYYSPDITGEQRPRAVERNAPGGTEMVRLSRPVFEKVAYRESPDGWLAVVPPVGADLADLRLGERPLVLVCEGVEKPGNLGAMLRTADAAGVDAVIAAGPVTDWGNPNVVRASKGTVFSVPVASASTEDALRWLRQRGLRLVAAAVDTDTLITDVDLTGPIALAVGAEKTGLSAPLLAVAGVHAKIPMFGRADSLNVATAAAIATYEAVRQRLAGQHS